MDANHDASLTLDWLAKELRESKESLLQLLLTIRLKTTLGRIIFCPTFPVPVPTVDLKARVAAFRRISGESQIPITDSIGYLYTHCVGEKMTKRMGQYFTPLRTAIHAIDALKPLPGESVLDPGCGVGVFAQALLRQRPSDLSADIVYLGVESDPLLAL